MHKISIQSETAAGYPHINYVETANSSWPLWHTKLLTSSVPVVDLLISNSIPTFAMIRCNVGIVT